MERSLLVKGGTLAGPARADVWIREGRIHRVGPDLSAPGVPVLEAAGRLVFPGVVDAHVQLEVIHGATAMTDDFDTGTRAAACGGVTTIIDFADQPRGRDALEYLRERKTLASSKVNVDYALHMSLTDLSAGTLERIPEIVQQEGTPSFKLYLAYSRIGRMVNEGETYGVLREVARQRGVVGVHAESDAVVEFLIRERVQNGEMDSRYFPRSRPDFAEAASVASTIVLARAAGCDLYIHHVSTALAVDLIAAARREGLPIYAETCPQYLLLTEEVYERADRNLFILNPPLRKNPDRERLWQALAAGEIDTVATDHCSYVREQKMKADRFDQIPPGLPGVETLLPVMYTEGVAAGRIPLGRLVELLCINPARIFGLFPRKGTISEGSDGDLVIFNPQARWTMRAADLKTNSDFHPFEGRPMVGRVEKTVLRGEVVYDGRDFCGTPRGGLFLPGHTRRE